MMLMWPQTEKQLWESSCPLITQTLAFAKIESLCHATLLTQVVFFLFLEFFK